MKIYRPYVKKMEILTVSADSGLIVDTSPVSSRRLGLLLVS